MPRQTAPDPNEPETPWPHERIPIVGQPFLYGSNQTVTIETVTDSFVYFDNGARMRRA